MNYQPAYCQHVSPDHRSLQTVGKVHHHTLAAVASCSQQTVPWCCCGSFLQHWRSQQLSRAGNAGDHLSCCRDCCSLTCLQQQKGHLPRYRPLLLLLVLGLQQTHSHVPQDEFHMGLSPYKVPTYTVLRYVLGMVLGSSSPVDTSCTACGHHSGRSMQGMPLGILRVSEYRHT